MQPETMNATITQKVQSCICLFSVIRTGVLDLRQRISPDEEVSGRSSVGTYLGFLVPGVVITPVGAFSSPAAIANTGTECLVHIHVTGVRYV